jgi:hypothetical protein
MAEIVVRVCDLPGCGETSVCRITIDHTNSQASRVLDLCKNHYGSFQNSFLAETSTRWQESDTPRSYTQETWTDVNKK